MSDKLKQIISKDFVIGCTHIDSPITFTFTPNIDPTITQSMTGDPVPASVIKLAPYILVQFDSDVFHEELFQEIDRAIKIFGGFIPIRCAELTELVYPINENVGLYSGTGSTLIRELETNSEKYDDEEYKKLKSISHKLEIDTFVQAISSDLTLKNLYTTVFNDNYVAFYSVITRRIYSTVGNITRYELVLEPIDMLAYFPNGIAKFLKTDDSIISQEVIKRYLETYGNTLLNTNYFNTVSELTQLLSGTPYDTGAPPKHSGVELIDNYILSDITDDVKIGKLLKEINTQDSVRETNKILVRAFQTKGNKLSTLIYDNEILKCESEGKIRLIPKKNTYDLPKVEISSIFHESSKLSKSIFVDDGDTLSYDSETENVKRKAVRILGVDTFETPKIKPLTTAGTTRFYFLLGTEDADPTSISTRVYDTHMRSINNGLMLSGDTEVLYTSVTNELPIFTSFQSFSAPGNPGSVHLYELKDNRIQYVQSLETSPNTQERREFIQSLFTSNNSDLTSVDPNKSYSDLLLYYLMSIMAGHNLYDYLDLDPITNYSKLNNIPNVHWAKSGKNNTLAKSYNRNVGYLEGFTEKYLVNAYTPGFLPACYIYGQKNSIYDKPFEFDLESYVDMFIRKMEYSINVVNDYLKKETPDTINELLQNVNTILITSYLFADMIGFFKKDIKENLRESLLKNLKPYTDKLFNYIKRSFLPYMDNNTKPEYRIPIMNGSHINGNAVYTLYSEGTQDSYVTHKLYRNSLDIKMYQWNINDKPLNFGSIQYHPHETAYPTTQLDDVLPKVGDQYIVTSSLLYNTAVGNQSNVASNVSVKEVFESVYFYKHLKTNSSIKVSNATLINDPEQLYILAQSVLTNSTLFPELSSPYRKLINSIYEPMYSSAKAIKYATASETIENLENELNDEVYYRLLNLNVNTYTERKPLDNNDLIIDYSALSTLNKTVPEIVRDSVLDLMFMRTKDVFPVFDNYRLDVFYGDSPFEPTILDSNIEAIMHKNVLENIFDIQNGKKYIYKPVLAYGDDFLNNKMAGYLSREIKNQKVPAKDMYSILDEIIGFEPDKLWDSPSQIFSADKDPDLTFGELTDHFTFQVLTTLNYATNYLKAYYKDSEESDPFKSIDIFETVSQDIIEEYTSFIKSIGTGKLIRDQSCSDIVSSAQRTKCEYTELSSLVGSNESYLIFYDYILSIENLLDKLSQIQARLYIPKKLVISNNSITSIRSIVIDYTSNNVTLRSSFSGVGNQKQYVNSSMEYVNIEIQTKDVGLVKNLLLLYYTSDLNSKAIIGVDKSRNLSGLSSIKNLTIWSDLENRIGDTLERLRENAKKNFDYTIIIDNNFINSYGIKSGFINTINVEMIPNRIGEYSITLGILKSNPKNKRLGDIKNFNLSPYRQLVTEYLITNSIATTSTKKDFSDELYKSSSWVGVSQLNQLVAIITLLFYIVHTDRVGETSFSGFKDLDIFRFDIVKDNLELSDKFYNHPEIMLFAALSFIQSITESSVVDFTSNLNSILSRLVENKQQIKSGIIRSDLAEQFGENDSNFVKYRTGLLAILGNNGLNLINTSGIGYSPISSSTNVDDMYDMLYSIVDELKLYTSADGIDWALSLRFFILSLINHDKSNKFLYPTRYGTDEDNTEIIAFLKNDSLELSSSAQLAYDTTNNARMELKSLIDTLNRLNEWENTPMSNYSIKMPSALNSMVTYYNYNKGKGKNLLTVNFKSSAQLIRKLHSLLSIFRSYGYTSYTDIIDMLDINNAIDLKHELPLIKELTEFFATIERDEFFTNQPFSEQEYDKKVKSKIKSKLIFYGILLSKFMVSTVNLGMDVHQFRFFVKGELALPSLPSLSNTISRRFKHLYHIYTNYRLISISYGYEKHNIKLQEQRKISPEILDKFEIELDYTKEGIKYFDKKVFDINIKKIKDVANLASTEYDKVREANESKTYRTYIKNPSYTEPISRKYRMLDFQNIYELFKITLVGSSINITRSLSEEIYKSYIAPVVFGYSLIGQNKAIPQDILYFTSSSLMFGTLGSNNPSDYSNFDLGYYADSKLPKVYVYGKVDIIKKLNSFIEETGDNRPDSVIYNLFETLLMGSKTNTTPFFFLVDDKLIRNVMQLSDTNLYKNIKKNVDNLVNNSYDDTFHNQNENNVSVSINKVREMIKEKVLRNNVSLNTQLQQLKIFYSFDRSQYAIIDKHIKAFTTNSENIYKTFHQTYTSIISNIALETDVNTINTSLGQLNKALGETARENIETLKAEIDSIKNIQVKVNISGMSYTPEQLESTNSNITHNANLESIHSIFDEIISLTLHTINLKVVESDFNELAMEYDEFLAHDYADNEKSIKRTKLSEILDTYSELVNKLNNNQYSNAITSSTKTDLNYLAYNKIANNLSKDNTQLGKLFPVFKILFYNDEVKEFVVFEDMYIFSRVVSFTIGSAISSPITELSLLLEDPFGDLFNIQSTLENRKLYGINPFLLKSLDKMQSAKFAFRLGTNVQVRVGYSSHLDESCIVFNGKISSLSPNGESLVSCTALSHGSTLSETFSGTDKHILPVTELDDFNLNVDAREKVPGATNLIYTLYAMNALPFSGVDNFGNTNEHSINDVENKLYDDSGSSSQISQRLRNPMTYLSKLGISNNYSNLLLTNVRPFRKLECYPHSMLYKSPDSTWSMIKEMGLHYMNNKILVRPFDNKETLIFAHETASYYTGTRFKRSLVNFEKSIENTDPEISNKSTQTKFDDVIRKLKKILEFEYYNLKEDVIKLTPLSAIAFLLGTYAYNISTGNINQYTDLDFMNINFELKYTKENLETINSKLDEIIESDVSIYLMVSFLTKISNFLKSSSTSYREVSKVHLKDSTSIIVNALEEQVNANGVRLTYLDDVENNAIYASGKELLKGISKIANKAVMRWSMNVGGTTSQDLAKNKVGLKLLLESNASEFARTILNAVPFSNYGRTIKNLYDKGYWKTRDYALTERLKLGDRTLVLSEHANVLMFQNYNEATGVDHRKVVASSILNNVLNEYYGGSVIMYGDNDIFVGDKIYLQDYSQDIYGVVEIRSVLHNFDAETGFTTSIIPSLLAFNDVDNIEQTESAINFIDKHATSITLGTKGLALALFSLVGVAKVMGSAGSKMAVKKGIEIAAKEAESILIGTALALTETQITNATAKLKTKYEISSTVVDFNSQDDGLTIIDSTDITSLTPKSTSTYKSKSQVINDSDFTWHTVIDTREKGNTKYYKQLTQRIKEGRKFKTIPVGKIISVDYNVIRSIHYEASNGPYKWLGSTVVNSKSGKGSIFFKEGSFRIDKQIADQAKKFGIQLNAATSPEQTIAYNPQRLNTTDSRKQKLLLLAGQRQLTPNEVIELNDIRKNPDIDIDPNKVSSTPDKQVDPKTSIRESTGNARARKNNMFTKVFGGKLMRNYAKAGLITLALGAATGGLAMAVNKAVNKDTVFEGDVDITGNSLMYGLFDIPLQMVAMPVLTGLRWAQDELIEPIVNAYELAKTGGGIPLNNIIMPVYKRGVPLIPNINLYPSSKKFNWVGSAFRGYLWNTQGIDSTDGSRLSNENRI